MGSALAYPFLLKDFHAGISDASGEWSFLAWFVLALACAVPLAGIYAAARLSQISEPSSSDLLAKQLALLSVAAAPIFTACGVLLYMAGDPISDLALWPILWGAAGVLLLIGGRVAVPAAESSPPATARLRVAHGIGALVIVLLFLAMHLVNHLIGLGGEAAHRQAMELFETVYRARLVEPLVVLLFLFLVVTGLALFWHHTKRQADLFRTLQIASGIYLVFFIVGHMNSVFFYARGFAHIPTDWSFATGAPSGLIQDAWNIRLLPHYLLGVFFVLSHLVLGARVVAIAHGADCARADRLAWLGLLLSGAVSVAIILGMTGVRLP
jgi:hypothetical protein